MYGDHLLEFGLSAAVSPTLARGDSTFRAEKCIRATQTFENRKNREKHENREKSQKSRKTQKSQKSQNLRTYVCRDVKSTRLRV